MIGLTKSLSPLGFDRSQGEEGGRDATPSEAEKPSDDEPAVGSPVVAIAADPDAFPVAPAESAPVPVLGQDGGDTDAVVVSFPAVAKVTVVTEEVMTTDQDAASVGAPAEESAIPLPEPLPVIGLAAANDASPENADTEVADDVVSAEAISAIEADIASLLASLDREELSGDDPLPIELFAGEAGDDAQVGALLSELDRLWQADPAVSAGRGA
jgi:hypothetical protein